MSISALTNITTSQFDEATATSYLGKTNRGTYVFSGEAKMVSVLLSILFIGFMLLTLYVLLGMGYR